MTKQPQDQYVDLVISVAKGAKQNGNFRFCTLSKKGSQKTINLRLPDEIQEQIISAYESGKFVRVFA